MGDYSCVVISKENKRSRKSMSFEQAVNLPYHDTPFNEFYDAVIDYLGGIDKITPCLPATKEELIEAYKVDKNFNSIFIRRWDTAAGFEFFGHAKYIQKRSRLQDLLIENGIRIYSISDCVSLLKRTAERIVEQG